MLSYCADLRLNGRNSLIFKLLKRLEAIVTDCYCEEGDA
jgi:hypothetical protein